MENLPRRTLVLYVCAGIVFLGAAYYYLVFNRDSGTATENDTVAASDAEITFMALVGRIDPITFDVSILTDPRFTALVDIKTAVLPEAEGRKDPFAPYSRVTR